MKETQKVLVGIRGGQNQDETGTDSAASHKLMHMDECMHNHASVCVCAHVL